MTLEQAPRKPFRVTIEVGTAAGDRWERLEAVVDTGAAYLGIPQALARQLGLRPQRSQPFVLASGERVNLPVAQVMLRLPEVPEVEAEAWMVRCTLLPDGGPSLLGIEALEAFNLAVEPVEMRLFRTYGYLV